MEPTLDILSAAVEICSVAQKLYDNTQTAKCYNEYLEALSKHKSSLPYELFEEFNSIENDCYMHSVFKVDGKLKKRIIAMSRKLSDFLLNSNYNETNELHGKVTKLKRDLTCLVKQGNTILSNLEKLQHTQDQQGEKIDNVKETVGKQGETIDNVKETVGQQGETIDNVKETVGQQGEAIAKLHAATTQMQNQNAWSQLGSELNQGVENHAKGGLNWLCGSEENRKKAKKKLAQNLKEAGQGVENHAKGGLNWLCGSEENRKKAKQNLKEAGQGVEIHAKGGLNWLFGGEENRKKAKGFFKW